MSQEFIGQLGGLVAMWEVKPLPEYVFFQEGPGLRKWQWTESGMKVINVTNIVGDGSVDVNNTARYISIEEFKKTYSHFAVQDDDIVVASSGNTYGKIGRIKSYNLPVMMNTSVIRLHSKNRERLDQDYLYAFLRSDYFTNQVENFVTGSAQPNFGPSHLKMMGILTPPLPIQRKIAAILSAYDDLIENNTRRIQILEDMARNLYREWFVHFRFPGHENTPMVESALGPIPEGWNVTTFDKALTLQRGFDLPTQNRIPGLVPIYAATGITGTHAEAKVKAPGVVTGRSGSLGTVMYVNEDFWPLNTTLWVKEFKTVTPLFAFYLLRTLDLNSFNSGAAVPTLNRNDLSSVLIVVPPEKMVAAFDLIALPLHQSTENLKRKNQNLRKTRDLLLPRLISGELDVSRLEIALKESVA